MPRLFITVFYLGLRYLLKYTAGVPMSGKEAKSLNKIVRA